LDSPAANAAFSRQIGLTFPLLSDMNRKMLKTYGILKNYNLQDETYEWALRANIVIDKQGIIQFVEADDSAVEPNTALTMCTTLHKKEPTK
jgi:peroxiredoxin Q/BCP